MEYKPRHAKPETNDKDTREVPDLPGGAVAITIPGAELIKKKTPPELDYYLNNCTEFNLALIGAGRNDFTAENSPSWFHRDVSSGSIFYCGRCNDGRDCMEDETFILNTVQFAKYNQHIL